jgi:hypothetical protein
VRHCVAADISQGDFTLFDVSVNKLDQLPSALFCQGGNCNPHNLAIVGGIQSKLRFPDRLFDRGHGAPVPWLNNQHSRLGNRDAGELIERGRAPVIVDRESFHQGRRSAARSNGGQVATKRVDGFAHSDLCVVHDVFDHAMISSATS